MQDVFTRASASRVLTALRGIVPAVPRAASLRKVPVRDDLNTPKYSTRLMQRAARGNEYSAHGDRQAGELNLNPANPREQLAKGLLNNAQSSRCGSPLAGVTT